MIFLPLSPCFDSFSINSFSPPWLQLSPGRFTMVLASSEWSLLQAFMPLLSFVSLTLRQWLWLPGVAHLWAALSFLLALLVPLTPLQLGQYPVISQVAVANTTKPTFFYMLPPPVCLLSHKETAVLGWERKRKTPKMTWIHCLMKRENKSKTDTSTTHTY